MQVISFYWVLSIRNQMSFHSQRRRYWKRFVWRRFTRRQALRRIKNKVCLGWILGISRFWVKYPHIWPPPTQFLKLSFSDTFDPSDWPSKPVPRNTNSNSNSKFDSSKFETKFNSHVMENDQPSSNGSKSGLSGALKSGLTKNSTFASFNSVGSMKTNSSVESIWSNNNSSSVSIC